MKKRMKKRNFICLISLIFTLLIPMTVSAAGETSSLHIHYYHDNGSIPNAFFRIFRIADMSERGVYTITKSFSDYSLSFDDLKNDDGELAAALAAYADRDNIVSEAEGNTDAQGNLYFRDIPAGIYLVTGSAVTLDKNIYFPQPSIVPVPARNNDGILSYEVTIEPKFESRPIDENIERKVLKIWKDGGNEQNRPNEITVQLLCNGKVYEEQTLNAKNNWRYTWKELDPAYNWQILEKEVPENYKLAVKQQGVTFTLTNTYHKPNDQPTTTPPTSTSSDTPTSNQPTSNQATSNQPTSNQPTSNIPETPLDKLPQTGMLWWPVPILLGIGAILCIIGGIVYKGRKYDE